MKVVQGYRLRTKSNIFSDEILQDPYPTYARLHQEGPAHYLAVGPDMGVWSIFSHAEISTIARDPRLSAKRAQKMISILPLDSQSEFRELARMLSLWLIFMDPPEHTRLRKLLNKGFSPAAVEGLRPQVEAIVERTLKPLKHGSEVELMTEFANPLPALIILEMLGVPLEMQDTFVNWSRDIAAFRGRPDSTVEQARAAQTALAALTDFFRQTVADRRRHKGSDLISLLIDIEEEGEVLTEEELYAQCVALLFRRPRDDSKSYRQRNVHAPEVFSPARDRGVTERARRRFARPWRNCCVSRAPFSSRLACSRKI